MVSHAANPLPVFTSEQIMRVYFTTRDKSNRSHVAYADFDIFNKFKVVKLCDRPVIEPGGPGYFDDSGAAMGYYLEHEGNKFIYYLGWNLKVTVPWQNSIGLAVAASGSDTFLKYSQAPLLDRSSEDPFSISYPAILFENKKFRMWYGSNLSWGSDQREMHHVIKYAESDNGIHWVRKNQICIDLKYQNEYAISKPFVLKSDEFYNMWYSYRGNEMTTTYRIGYAVSKDGINWVRKDELAGINVSNEGWDSEMICYASVFRHLDRHYMLYNGNGFGKTGFGLAMEERHGD